MKKRTLAAVCLVIIQLLVLSLPAAAADLPISDNGKENWNAPGNSPVITDDGKLDLVRVDFVHSAKNGGSPSSKKPDPGYKLMGVKWLWQEGYVINLTNAPSSVSSDAEDVIKDSSLTWDAETSCKKTTGLDLFNVDAITLDNSAAYGTYDGINAVSFGTYGEANVIAVTSVWYSRSTKAIYEFDMLFNTDYDWSASGDADAMDLQNIATHEFGHAVGLSDIYSSTYNYVTMYGYADFGEVNKTDLADPDIAGIHTIYGE